MNQAKIAVGIKEKSWVARIAAFKLGSTNCAIVFGQTIYLWGATRADLLNNTSWLRHEVMHVLQWKREGYIRFLFKYVWLSMRYGYRNNPLEIEAQQAINDKEILNKVHIV